MMRGFVPEARVVPDDPDRRARHTAAAGSRAWGNGVPDVQEDRR